MLFRRTRTPSRFVEPHAFDRNLKKQLELAPLTLADLQKHGVSPEVQLRLEFFFYSSSSANALTLTSCLNTKGYQAHTAPSAHDNRLLLVNGWTTPVPMHLASILDWTETMCRLGFEHDCDFDGWGTLLDQTDILGAAPEKSSGDT